MGWALSFEKAFESIVSSTSWLLVNRIIESQSQKVAFHSQVEKVGVYFHHWLNRKTSNTKQHTPISTLQQTSEQPQPGENGEPKGVLPANFFDYQLEGMVASGVKQKQAERELKQ